jgi:hypothetical protein
LFLLVWQLRRPASEGGNFVDHTITRKMRKCGFARANPDPIPAADLFSTHETADTSPSPILVANPTPEAFHAFRPLAGFNAAARTE